MTLRTALRTSSNRAAVRLLQEVGVASTVRYAKNMGVGDQPAVPSLALGSGEVTLQAMTAAYAAFANHGQVPSPLFIRRVEDQSGQLLYSAEPSTTQAITEATAFLMANMLADVVNAGTAWRARQLGFTLPAGGKTGTTNAFKDAWFVGFTPNVIAGVWVGFDEPRTILPDGFASDLAVPVWTSFMKVATRGQKPAWLEAPPSIVTARVCRLSGALAVDGCERGGDGSRGSLAYTEYFVRGTQPTSSCELHQSRGLFGAIASLFGSKAPPPQLEDTGVPSAHQPPPPPPEVASAAPAEPQKAEQPEPPRKRGFWSRVFGIGRNDKRNDNEDARGANPSTR
jgi:membrane carboxypeptidase/penicillin-binding protein